MQVKPIETQYKGYRFRSRLEARWAVFFDSLDIDWEYEPEGFELDKNTRYLPDFLLKNFSCESSGLCNDRDTYIEVKPKQSLVDKKPFLFAKKTKHNILIALGVPSLDSYMLLGKREGEAKVFWVHKEFVEEDVYIRWPCLMPKSKKDKLFLEYHPDVLKAVCCARSARFEYEERKVY